MFEPLHALPSELVMNPGWHSHLNWLLSMLMQAPFVHGLFCNLHGSLMMTPVQRTAWFAADTLGFE